MNTQFKKIHECIIDVEIVLVNLAKNSGGPAVKSVF